MEYSNYENPEFYRIFSVAISQADTRAICVLNSWLSILGTFTQITTLTALLTTLDPKLILWVVISAVVSILCKKKTILSMHNLVMDKVNEQRKISYIQRVFYQPQFSLDLRVNTNTKYIFDRDLVHSTIKINNMTRQQSKHLIKLQLIGGLPNLTCNSIATIYLAKQIVFHNIDMGTFISSTSSCTQLYSQVTSFIGTLLQMYEHSLYINDYREFFKLTIKSPCFRKSICTRVDAIGLDNVSFCYQNSKRESLKGVTLSVKPGEKIVLVGPNGSGKTTLLKLICGLYLPTNGTVYINNDPNKTSNVYDYSNSISVLSQNSQVFDISIAENILLRPFCENDTEIVNSALEKVNLLKKVQGFVNGIHSIVSREFTDTGVMLSGGELQRILLARILVKNSSLILLDEPFKAVDNATREELIKLIFGLKNTTVILVSHHIDVISCADNIFVLNEGRIVESGSYQKLSAVLKMKDQV